MADKAETIVETPVEAPVETPIEAVAVDVVTAEAPAAPVTEAVEAAVEAPRPRRPRKAAAPKIAKPATVKPVKAAKAKKAPVKAAPKTVKTAKPKTAKPEAAALSFPTFSMIKDTLMTAKTTDFTQTFNDVVADAQEKAKTAYAQGTAAFGEAGEFAKGNAEAVVESGKILAAGLKELGSSLVEEGKVAFETLTADVKEMTAIKSPADLLKLQSEILRRNFDAAVAFGSKNTEAVMKLAGDAVAPISTRVSLAVEKVKKAA